MSSWKFAALLLFVAATTGPAFAQSPSFGAQVRPEMTISVASGPVRIDGLLDEDAWQSAARVSGFTETFPGDWVRPPYGTEVRLMYDDTFLYLAFVAYDDPATIRSTLRDRDAIFNDDHVGIILDTYGDGSWAYGLFFNPRGIQGDVRTSREGGDDASFDIVHRSEGRITDQGYVVEVAIPFSELRFPDQEMQEWRATFWRVRPRSSRETSTWAAISRDDPCFFCQLGTIKGIHGVQSGNSLRVLPALTVTQASQRPAPDAKMDNGRIKLQPSLGVSYGVSSSLTAEMTLNPDFSQIESDAGQIDVNTTTALFFDERRPFFQEGSDLYNSRINQLYTRSINAPLAAVKLTGRFNRTSVAYLGAWDDQSPVIVPLEERSVFLLRGASLVNIARLRQTFGSDNNIGLILTDRRYDEGGSGSTMGIDGRLRLTRSLSMAYHLAASQTEEGRYVGDSVFTGTFAGGRHTVAFDGEDFGGTGISVGASQDGRHLKASLSYSQQSPGFRAHTGFVNQNSNRNIFSNVQWVMYPKLRWVDEFRIMHSGGLIYNWDGLQKDRWSNPEIQIQLPGQTVVQTGYLWSRERFRGGIFPGIRRWEFNVSTSFSQQVGSGFSIEEGRFIARSVANPVLGRGHVLHFYLRLSPVPQLELMPSIAWQALRDTATDEEFFSVYILRNRLSYQFTRELFLRLITEYNHGGGRFDIQPLLTYKLNPFSVFYVGTNRQYWDPGMGMEPILSSRQYFLKAQYLF